MKLFFAKQKEVNKFFTSSTGLAGKWEDETIAALIRYERRSGSVLQILEIKSRVLQKLNLAGVSNRTHFAATIGRFIKEALADREKSDRRKKLRDGAPSPRWPQHHNSHFDEDLGALLSHDSPLSGSERAFLQIVIDDRAVFFRSDGRLKESALGKHLGIKRDRIARRWSRIQQKIEMWQQGQMEFSI